ncbi:MAG TPA: homogentisate 1,2-dioxygenase, partial [Mycobacteriales bacterium]|nr:homogentisate 1,2-dioxygenase [Mycobacteriales bacterium]
MPYYRSVGEHPRKRHTQFRQPDGRLYAEELMGVDGFSADAALLYHRHLPTAIVAADVVDEPVTATELRANLPLAPRHFRTHDVEVGEDLVSGRQLLLGNDDVRVSYVVSEGVSELYRNAIGDELVY